MRARSGARSTEGEVRLLRRAGIVAAWIAAVGFLAAGVGVATFFAVLKIETHSTQVTVPNICGMSREDAVRRASESGLVVEVAQERHDAQVTSGRTLQQDPPAGASVRRGRKIRVVLSLGGEVLRVPDLVGKADRQMAIELLRDGFVTGDEAVVPSRHAPAGTVLAQVPPPDSLAVPGMRVHRLVSSGPPPVLWVMPDLRGRSISKVETWISTSGLRKGTVRRVEAGDRAPGTVVGQFPAEGYPVSARDAVDLTVAR
jgi:beta-lactam-binding protein with PASTA domain